jgi:hypothetical protein
MLAIFSLRLATGLLAALALFPSSLVNPRFYRVHFLTCLGLAAVTAVSARDWATGWLWLALGLAMLCSFAGSLVWSLDKAPGGNWMIGAGGLVLCACLVLAGNLYQPDEAPGRLIFDELTSALLLGTAMTAMLMGHSYLIAPSMSIQPLLRLLGGLFVALILRAAVAGLGLWSWTGLDTLRTLNEVSFLLPVRWGIGLACPLVLGILAWKTARIRSTQSATGILYVVVIFAFLGELTSQVLSRMTGAML